MNEQILEFIGDGKVLVYMFLAAVSLDILFKLIKNHHNEKKN